VFVVSLSNESDNHQLNDRPIADDSNLSPDEESEQEERRDESETSTPDTEAETPSEPTPGRNNTNTANQTRPGTNNSGSGHSGNILVQGSNTPWSLGLVHPRYDEVLFFGFNSHDAGLMQASDGTSRSVADCTFRTGNISFANGIGQFAVRDTDGGTKPYSCAEYQTRNAYGHGMYEVSMRPINNVGAVSSFSIYTDLNNGILIEFLGEDTTKVRFSYIKHGVVGGERLHNLGFDAADGFNIYGFEWLANGIVWYVNGREVHRVNDSISGQTAKLYMSAWVGTGFDGNTSIRAEYDWVRISARN
jgi:hypothetical protein